MATKEEMHQLVEQLRVEIDDIAQAHGAAANLPMPAKSLAQIDLDEVTRQFEPERIGDQTMAQVESLRRCLECMSWTDSDDSVLAETDGKSDLVQQGRAIGAAVNSMLGEAWQIDLELRSEVDTLRRRIEEEGDSEAGAYAAEQKAVLLEKLLLLLLIALLLEAAKLCLLEVIRLLRISRQLLALAYNALVRAGGALETAVQNALANGTRIPAGTNPALDGRLALTVADELALQTALAGYRALRPIRDAAVRFSNQALTDALALLGRCLALQELARRLAARFLQVEKKLRKPPVEA